MTMHNLEDLATFTMDLLIAAKIKQYTETILRLVSDWYETRFNKVRAFIHQIRLSFCRHYLFYRSKFCTVNASALLYCINYFNFSLKCHSLLVAVTGDFVSVTPDQLGKKSSYFNLQRRFFAL